MKRSYKLLAAFCCILLLAISFCFAINAEGEEAYTPGDNVYFAAFSSEQSYLAGEAPYAEYVNNTDFCYEVVKSFTEGSYIVFYKDIIYIECGRIREYQSITIDLNGHSINKCGFGDSSTPSLNCRFIIPERADQLLVIKNGTIYNSEDNFFYTGSIYNTEEYHYAMGTVLFQDVVFEFQLNQDGKTSTPFDFRSGNIVIERCTINTHGHKTIVAIGMDEEPRHFVIKDSVVNMLDLPEGTTGDVCIFSHGSSARTVNAKVKAEVLNCEVNINTSGSDSVYRLAAAAMEPEGGSVEVNIRDSKLNVGEGPFNFTQQILGFEPVLTYSNNISVTLPDTNLFGGKITYMPGEELVTIDNDALYRYHVTTPTYSTIYVNVDAEGFGLNIYIPKDSSIQNLSVGRSVIYSQSSTYETKEIDGAEYNVINYDGITEKNAAVMLEFSLRYEGNNGYHYSRTFRYNLIKYFADVLATEAATPGSFEAESYSLVTGKAVKIYSTYDFFSDVEGSEEEVAYMKEVVESNGLW